MCREMLDGEQRIIISPLIKIEMLPLRRSMDAYSGLIFTSENGVRALAKTWDGRDLPAYCVGDRTANAARAAGFKALSAGGAADDLVMMIEDAGVAGRLLHVRGEHSRGDIATRLKQKVDEVVIYRQVAVPLTSESHSVLSGEQTVILPLFSPRTAQLFFKEAGQISAPLKIVVISKAVGNAVSGETVVAATPDAVSMVQAIKGRIDA